MSEKIFWESCRKIVCVFRVFCVRPPHATQNHADFAKLCAFAWEENISFCQKNCTQKSQKYTEFCSACFRESLRRLRETITLRTAFCEFRGFRVRPLPTRKALCSYVKKLHTEITEIHRIVLRMLLRMSAWDNNAPQGISVNSCPFVVQKLRVDTRKYVETFLCVSEISVWNKHADL